MKNPTTRALLLLSALAQASCHSEPPPATVPATSPALASPDVDKPAAYPDDLRSMCQAHMLSNMGPEGGFWPIEPWLRKRLESNKARQQLLAVWTTEPIEWMRALRRDALEAGISPCPLADTWEPLLERSWPASVPPTPDLAPSASPAPTSPLPSALPSASAAPTSPLPSALPSASAAPGAAQAGSTPALDQSSCPSVGLPPYPRPAREDKVEASLVARCIVEPSGYFGGCKLLRAHPMFDSTVKLLIAGAHPAPMTTQGQRVRVACNYPLRFKLE